MVGGYLSSVFESGDLYLTDVDTLDITDFAAVDSMIEAVRPQVVIHLAAETHVDRCEQDPDHAFRINTIGTQNIALASRKIQAKVVYLSTGAVFNGQQGQHYSEFDTAKPDSIYARSKFEGERIVRELATEHLIIRTGWVVGGGAGDHKFVGKILDQLATTRELQAVDDKRGCLTYAPDLLLRIKQLINLNYVGLFHVVNEGSANRFEIVEQIVSCLGLTDVKIKPVKSDQFVLPAPRPDSEVIENYKMKLMGLPAMRTWQEALCDYLKTSEMSRRLT